MTCTVGPCGGGGIFMYVVNLVNVNRKCVVDWEYCDCDSLMCCMDIDVLYLNVLWILN